MAARRRSSVATHPRSGLRWIRSRYGASPLHLLACASAFALAGYAALRFVPSNPLGVAAWLLGGALGHDLVLLPLYSLADRSFVLAVRRRTPPTHWVVWLNHVRVPAALSALMLLVFFPLILRLPPNLEGITGGPRPDYLGRWLLVTAALFFVSALVLALRLRLRGRHAPHGVRQDPSPAGQDQMLHHEGGEGLSAQPPSVRAGGQQRTGGDQPHGEGQPDPLDLGLAESGQRADDHRDQS
jgi:hypothetical protein